MPRRDPFARLKQPQSPTPEGKGGGQPPRPIDLIPIPRPKKRERRRDWERANPTQSYKIPADFHDRARAVQAALRGLAQQYQSTVDDVARALMIAALAAVREGEIRLDYRHNPQGRKMTVEVVREGGWPQELPKPKQRTRKKPLVMAFRWSAEVGKKITRLAGEAPKGAVVVLLLEAALERVKTGKWGLRPRPVTMKQEVTVATSRKNKW